MKMNKIDYITPTISIIQVQKEDVIATSAGFDTKDNWSPDVFDVLNF